jgi:hypothetical protein
MIELKDYFEGVKNNKEKIMIWIAGEDDSPVALNTYIDEVYTYDGRLYGVGCKPDLNMGYVELISMEQIIKISIIPEDMLDELFDRAKPNSSVPKQ